ncbi:8262_t:CDS:2, partial [Racocetra persica]
FYPIKSEKPWQAFYIVDQEGNNMDPLTYPDYLKYLKQAKALFKKLQRSNQSVRMDRIEEGFNETRDTINQLADQLQKKVYIKKFTESKQNEKITMPNPFSESDDQLLELLSPAIIEDIIIPDGFADTASGCLVMNKALNEIRKVQGILDTNKHEFRIIVRGKSYIIPTFTKPIKDNVLSSLYTTVIRDNNSKNQTFDSSTKIDTKEEPTSNKEKESQVSDSFTEDLKKKNIV